MGLCREWLHSVQLPHLAAFIDPKLRLIEVKGPLTGGAAQVRPINFTLV